MGLLGMGQLGSDRGYESQLRAVDQHAQRVHQVARRLGRGWVGQLLCQFPGRGVESANELGGEQNNGYTHFQLRHLDKALLGNDVHRRVVASGVDELPVKRGKAVNLENPVASAVIGGWSLGVIAEFQTGSTYCVFEQTNRSNALSHGQRPNRLGDHNLSGSRSKSEQLARWFDTSQFEAPGVGVFGNSPRNLCCGPEFAVVDVSIQKRFQISE